MAKIRILLQSQKKQNWWWGRERKSVLILREAWAAIEQRSEPKWTLRHSAAWWWIDGSVVSDTIDILCNAWLMRDDHEANTYKKLLLISDIFLQFLLFCQPRFKTRIRYIFNLSCFRQSSSYTLYNVYIPLSILILHKHIPPPYTSSLQRTYRWPYQVIFAWKSWC